MRQALRPAGRNGPTQLVALETEGRERRQAAVCAPAHPLYDLYEQQCHGCAYITPIRTAVAHWHEAPVVPLTSDHGHLRPPSPLCLIAAELRTDDSVGRTWKQPQEPPACLDKAGQILTMQTRCGGQPHQAAGSVPVSPLSFRFSLWRFRSAPGLPHSAGRLPFNPCRQPSPQQRQTVSSEQLCSLPMQACEPTSSPVARSTCARMHPHILHATQKSSCCIKK